MDGPHNHKAERKRAKVLKIEHILYGEFQELNVLYVSEATELQSS